MKSKLFDVAEQHATEILKNEKQISQYPVQYPVFKLESGTWFGNIYAVVKVEPCTEFDGVRTNFEILENMYPDLREKKEVRNDFDEWFDSFAPEQVEGNEIEYTDLVLQIDSIFGSQIGRVYKHKNELGMISPSFDYLSYNLKNSLNYISKGVQKPIIGLKPGLKDKTIKERAVIVIMPLDFKEKEIDEAIVKVEKEIVKLKGDDE